MLNIDIYKTIKYRQGLQVDVYQEKKRKSKVGLKADMFWVLIVFLIHF